MSHDFHPAASLAMLQLRARLLQAVRSFFSDRGYLEVETPLLSHDVCVDAHLEPFALRGRVGGETTLYLQTSPEFAMKRLLAAGAGSIYQITRAFRDGEAGRLHNPEFTMIEWYGVGDTHVEQMAFTEDLVRAVFAAAGQTEGNAFPRTAYRAAFQRHAGFDPFAVATAALPGLARARGLVAPEGLGDDRDAWLNLILAGLVEPKLGQAAPEFLHDYPASQAALARVRPDDPPVAERFELYVRGIELCNGYHELTDAAELRRRNARNAALRAAAGLPALPLDSRLLDAMDAGLPACAGVALGFDRLLMLAAGAAALADVLPFPFARA